MSAIINNFLKLPIGFRSAIAMLLIVILWWMMGKKILYICSLFPFLLNQIYRWFYLLVEIPVTVFHKKIGGFFYTIDNQLSKIGREIDDKIHNWYVSWHSPKSAHIGKVLVIYAVLIIFITLPSFIKIENKLLITGQNVYLKIENGAIAWLESHELYNAYETVSSGTKDIEDDNLKNSETISDETIEEKLIVYGLNTFLAVRDIPSVQDGNKLTSLYNGDEVIWKGRLIFAEAEGHIEPWVKIITSEGIEGWSRLSYLHPEQYENIEFKVIK